MKKYKVRFIGKFIVIFIVMFIAWKTFYGNKSLPEEENTYTKLKEKWRNQLVSDDYDDTNVAVVNYVQTLSKEAEELYQKMDRAPNRAHLWSVDQGDTLSADLTTQFGKLHRLAVAYGTKGSTFYRDPLIAVEIENGIDFMVSEKGYNGKKYSGNWWDWQIGVPQKFIGILIVLGEKISKEKQLQYTTVMSGYVPDPFKQLYTIIRRKFVPLIYVPDTQTSGANRVNLAQIVLGLGILEENESKIRQASNSIVDVVKLVRRGDGFYQDGSFIQHNTVPCTGTYGNELIKGVSEILGITKDSKFEMTSEIVHSFVENVDRAFIPLIYKGETLPGVNGRVISRAPAKTKVGYGSASMYNLLIVAKISAEKYQKRIKEAVKYWINENKAFYLTNARDYNDLQMTISLLGDGSIIGNILPFIGTKMYASMDRFVQRTPNYMLGLSMYSNRISSFETGNRENKHGWHTADGMMYLYNDDEVQFNSAYWPTIDPYRLPGTTVDTAPLKDEVSYFTMPTSEENWVGGVEFENQAVVGMALNKRGTENNGEILPMNLSGRKSWFVADGQIVALGAGITGNTNTSIETIIDNRMLNDNYTYQVLSNIGKIKQNNEHSKIEWLLLQSDHEKVNIGYYFPENVTVAIIGEVRTGTYKDINELFPSNDIYTSNYLKFIINHGKQPVREKYAYVTLPGVNETMLKWYAASKPVKILANSAHIQAIQIKISNYLGVNMWQDTGGSIAGITSNKAVSLLKKISKGKKTYVLSHPTQSKVVMKIKLPKDYQKILSMSEGIRYDANTNIFTINFKKSKGTSKKIIVE